MTFWGSLEGSVSSSHSTRPEMITPRKQRLIRCPGSGNRHGNRLLTIQVVLVISPHRIINHRLVDDPSTTRKSHTHLFAKRTKPDQKLTVWALFSFVRIFTFYDWGNVAKATLRPAPSFSSVQSLSRVRLFATPWIAAHQASLSITNSWSLLKLMSIKSVMPSNHLILCCPLLPLASLFPYTTLFRSSLPTPRVYSNWCPLSQWCHPTISSSVIPFSSRLQYFPASGSFQKSHFFASDGQSIGVSVSISILPINI